MPPCFMSVARLDWSSAVTLAVPISRGALAFYDTVNIGFHGSLNRLYHWKGIECADTNTANDHGLAA